MFSAFKIENWINEHIELRKNKDRLDIIVDILLYPITFCEERKLFNNQIKDASNVVDEWDLK